MKKSTNTNWTPERIAAELMVRRQRVERRTGRKFTQVDAANVVSVSLTSYRLAERHGVARGNVRALVLDWLKTPVDFATRKLVG